MKFFAYQRGPRGPEPVVFRDERPKGRAHVQGLVDGSIREIPPELADLSVAQLAEHFKGK